MTRRAQDLVLIGLAMLAALTIYFAFSNVRSAPEPERTRVESDLTSSTTVGPAAASTPQDGSTEGADTTSGPSDESDAKEAPTASDDPLTAARDILASGDEVTIAVLGDSTSNERSDWVHLWAQSMAEGRPVSISHWNESDGTRYNEPDVLSEDGDGGAITIWSGSQAGAGANFPVERLEAMVPEEPDFVIINFGHNNTVDNVGAQLGELQEAIADRYGDVPLVVILQNPQVEDRNAAVREAVAAWAADHGAATIDVASALDPEDWPLLDEIHPSSEGQQVWADTVAEALN